MSNIKMHRSDVKTSIILFKFKFILFNNKNNEYNKINKILQIYY